MVTLFFAFLLVPLSLLHSSATQRPHPSPTHDLISFHYMDPISKTNFRNPGGISLTRTSTQTTPGTYVFVDDIGYQGTSTSRAIGGNTAFFAASDNLVIDLGGKTLYQNNATAGTNGIEINTGQKNVTIKNGSIVGFKGAGIYVRSGCDNIRIQNVVISNCGTQGIYLAGTSTSGTDVSNCIIEDCIVSRTTGISGTAHAIALELDYCQNIFVHNSVFSHSDATAAAMDGIGVFVQGCTNVVFDRCDASTNKGQNAYGFKLTGTAITSSSCAFSNCTAQNNTGTSVAGGMSYGFYANATYSCLWKNCIAAGNSATKNGYGFYTLASQYTNHLACEGIYNTAGTLATLATDGGRGFYTSGGIGNIYTDCIATGNQGNSANATTMGIGFEFQSENYAIISGCEARANGSDSSTAWGVGIYCNNCAQTILKNSRFFNNRSSTAGQGYGFYDTAANSTSLVADCFFFGNGQGTTCTNFCVTYPGLGELNTTASVSTGGLGGISLIKPFQNVTVTPL